MKNVTLAQIVGLILLTWVTTRASALLAFAITGSWPIHDNLVAIEMLGFFYFMVTHKWP